MSKLSDGPGEGADLLGLIEKFREASLKSRAIGGDLEEFLNQMAEEVFRNNEDTADTGEKVLGSINEILHSAGHEGLESIEGVTDVVEDVCNDLKKVAGVREDITDAIDDILVRTPDIELRERLEAFAELLRYDDKSNIREILAKVVLAPAA